MKVSTFIALRYLFSRKEKTVINLISWISLIGITVSTMALVVVMSVYNGIGELTQSLYNVFDPELIVEPVEGKTFRTTEIPYNSIVNNKGVANVSQIVEENAWITLRQAEAIVQLRGVDESYGAACGLDTMVREGTYLLKAPNPETGHDDYFLILGYDIMVRLGVNSLTNIPLSVHIPKRGTSSFALSIDGAFNNGYAYTAGTFIIQEDINKLYVISDIDFVRNLMTYSPDEVTALAISCVKKANVAKVKKELRQLLGDNFTVKDRHEQKPLYYKIFRSEKLGVFLILSLIVLISTLSLIASLSLLIINKRRDINVLLSMGMEQNEVRRIFRNEGILIALVGVVAGLVLGFVVCLIQQYFGLIKLGNNAIVEAFPVAMRFVDFLAAFLVVTLLSSIVVSFTVRKV
ncbi:MAG: ABC transporter permease [Bacteroidales bacterium]|nr:ABC transporter permease [Bacteroidales bacterium]